MNIKRRRKIAGLTQQALAEALGVHQTAVAGWEKGRSTPRAAHMIKLAALFGCTVDDLLKDGGTAEEGAD